MASAVIGEGHQHQGQHHQGNGGDGSAHAFSVLKPLSLRSRDHDGDDPVELAVWTRCYSDPLRSCSTLLLEQALSRLQGGTVDPGRVSLQECLQYGRGFPGSGVRGPFYTAAARRVAHVQAAVRQDAEDGPLRAGRISVPFSMLSGMVIAAGTDRARI